MMAKCPSDAWQITVNCSFYRASFVKGQGEVPRINFKEEKNHRQWRRLRECKVIVCISLLITYYEIGPLLPSI